MKNNSTVPCLVALLAPFVIMVFLFTTLNSASGSDQQISLTVQRGKVIVGDKEQDIGPGTFIPAPYDADLAKKIIDCHAEQDKLKVMLDSCEKRFLRYDSYWEEREKKLVGYYEDNQKLLKDQLAQATGWWNEWGKPVLSAIISASVATITTWGIMK